MAQLIRLMKRRRNLASLGAGVARLGRVRTTLPTVAVGGTLLTKLSKQSSSQLYRVRLIYNLFKMPAILS